MTNPRNATTTTQGRSYKWGDEEFDSVTTIIGGGVPKPALKAWGEKLVATTAVARRKIWQEMTTEEAIDWLKRSPFRETDKAAAQGTDIHEWAEAHVLGQRLELPESQKPYGAAFLQFLEDFKPAYEMSEATVYNRTYRYAGTLDFFARIDGLGLVLGDYKTGKGVYSEVGLQLAAYRHAEFIGLLDGTETPLPAVDTCAVLHLTPKGYALIPVEAGEAEFQAFLNAQQVRQFLQRRDVLRSPVLRANA